MRLFATSYWNLRAPARLAPALALLVVLAPPPALGAGGYDFGTDDHKANLSLNTRFRYECWDAHASDTRCFTAFRSRAALRYKFQDLLEGLVEAQDARLNGLDSDGSGAGALYYTFGRMSSKTSSQDIRQLWVKANLTEEFAIKGGRQDIKLGKEVMYPEANWKYLKNARLSERLVGTVGWTHGERSNDALAFISDFGDHHLFVFGGKPTTGVFDVDRAYSRQDDIKYGGFQWTAKRGTWVDDTEIRIFGISYMDERDADDRGTTVSDRRVRVYTTGVSALGVKPMGDGNFDYLLWGAYQWGSFPERFGAAPFSGDLSQSAWALLAEFGYQCTNRDWKPWFRGGVNIASGDDDPSDSDSETFFNILPTNHKFYGFQDRFALSNLINYFVQLKLSPSDKMGVNMFLHHLLVFDDDDSRVFGTGAFTKKANFGYGYDNTRLGRRSLGTAIDVILDYKVNKNLALQGGYTYMWGHARFNNLSDDDVRWGYLQATLKY